MQPVHPTVITIGETMLRLSPANGRPLESSDLWSVDVAGAESNVAVSLARLGMPVGWISRLPATPLGRKAAGAIRLHGVDTSRVIWSPTDRQGLYFLDPGPAPRCPTVLYDRANSAMANAMPEEVDWEYVRSARILHLTGITPALGEGPRQLALRAIREIHEAGGQVSFDLNYRSMLWRPAEARTALEPLMAGADILIAGRRDLSLLFPELGADSETVLRSLSARFQPEVAIVTCEGDGALALCNGQLRRRHAVQAENVDRVGRGDAFAAGFLHGYLLGGVQTGLAHGTAMAALKMTYPGDFPWITGQDLDRVLAGEDTGIVR